MSVQPTKLSVSIPRSPTISIKLIVDQMKSDGKTVYDFGVGEMNPTMPIPSIFKQEMIKAVQNNEGHYCNPAGDEQLVDALCKDLRTNFGLEYTSKQIAVCPGPKAALYFATMALLSPFESRNRAVAFLPLFEAFTDIPFILTGKHAIRVGCDENFFPNLEQLQQTLERDETIKLIYINSPNNPSGAVFPSTFYQKLSNLMKKFPDVGIISDEVYRTIAYIDPLSNSRINLWYDSIARYLPEQTLVCGGISKEVAGTGLRAGFIAGPASLISPLVSLIGCSIVCTCLPIQRGLGRFLRSDISADARLSIRDELRKKRDIVIDAFNRLPGLNECRYTVPQGAFYFFPNVKTFIGRIVPAEYRQVQDNKTEKEPIIQSDVDLALYLLRSGGVVTIPGSSFGYPDHLRIAYAKSTIAEIESGCKQMSISLQKLQRKHIKSYL